MKHIYSCGQRQYAFVAVDIFTKQACIHVANQPSSYQAMLALQATLNIFGHDVCIVNDNGSEFHKHFHEACEVRSLTHFWNYPRTPKMNAYVERFNRTIQDEFIDYNLHLMADDIDQFNRDLMDWLIWYNTERPHFSLGQISPMCHLINNFGLSRMLWTRTAICIFCIIGLY